jgi:hypothetical protein
VNLLERLGELAKALFTTETQLRHLQDEQTKLREEVKQLAADHKDLWQRVIRLETLRDADRAQMAAELSRFKIELERAELRLTRMLPKGTDPAE